MIPPSGHGGRHRGWRSRPFVALAAALVVILAAAVVLIVRQATGGSPWTGVVIKVSQCPTDAEGCRAFVVPADDQQVSIPPVVAYAGWTGSATTLDVRLAAGSYAVTLEGCSGYESGYTSVAVIAGTHPTVDLSSGLWLNPAFLSRTCPGFHPVAGQPAFP